MLAFTHQMTLWAFEFGRDSVFINEKILTQAGNNLVWVQPRPAFFGKTTLPHIIKISGRRMPPPAANSNSF
jgi:hypothetical protein